MKSLLSSVLLTGGAALLLVACGSDDPPAAGTNGESTPFGADASSGGNGSSGDIGSSGAIGTSGGTSGGGSSGGTAGCASTPAEEATVAGYMDTLGNLGPKDAASKAKISAAIVKTCKVFGPPTGTGAWQEKYCWAHLASAISKESTYNPALIVKDSYGQRTIGGQKANDPTVGLLQIRFSSTVRDMAVEGRLDQLACVGCTLGADLSSHTKEAGDSAFWAVSGPSANMASMQSVECNVALGAWYYYVNSTGNGSKAKPTYLPEYCSGKGAAANLVTGLLSHLKGPDGGKGVITNIAGVNALQQSDNNAYQYVTIIKGSFDTMVGPVAGAHPFFLSLAPNVGQYCR